MSAGDLPARKYHSVAEFPIRLKLVRWLGHQTWLPHGQDRLLRSLLDPEKSGPYLFEVDFFGQRYRGDLAQYIDWVVFCYGAAPLSELKLLEEMTARIRTIRASPISFVDVGANVGHHTIFMAALADRVVSFEPYPNLLSLVREKIALNNLTNVHVVPVALGERDEIRKYFPGEWQNSGIGTFVPDWDSPNAVELQIRRGDDILDEIGVGRIDILKVDVEGFEPFVFRGMRNRLMKDRPAILTELSDASRSGFPNERAFHDCFYQDAEFATVEGRLGRTYTLRPFDYETSSEVIVVPPELADILR